MTLSANDLYEFVVGLGEELVHSGELKTSRATQYTNFVQDATGNWSRDTTWPHRAFQAFHYASLYLPLRYYVWSNAKGKRQLGTEEVLPVVLRETEMYLWSCLLQSAKWPSDRLSHHALGLDSNDRKIIDLCFGVASPVGPIESGESFAQWKTQYEQAVRVGSAKWKNEEMWPQVLCMAIHFASLYVELFQIRNIELTGNYAANDQGSRQSEPIIAGLMRYINNERVLALIRIWLDTCGMKRDDSGLPAIGTLRERTGQFVSVRTMSEVFVSSR
jgi:hypothetical protein